MSLEVLCLKKSTLDGSGTNAESARHPGAFSTTGYRTFIYSYPIYTAGCTVGERGRKGTQDEGVNVAGREAGQGGRATYQEGYVTGG